MYATTTQSTYSGKTLRSGKTPAIVKALCCKQGNMLKIDVSRDDTIRIKVINRCQFQCNFCHQEGNAESSELKINDTLIRNVKRLYYETGLTQIHLTGGEPTMYPYLTKLIRILKDIGFIVKMTTNGQFDELLLRDLKNAGLTSVNYSVHTLDPMKFCKIQKHSYDETWALTRIRRQLDNIKAARALGFKVKVNTVVGSDADIHDVTKIKDFCREYGAELRILNNLLQGEASIRKIEMFLGSVHAVREGINIMKNSSSYSMNMRDSDGFVFKIKLIRVKKLKTLCRGCAQQGKCKEWFYGIRIEQSDGSARVRLCMERHDYPAVQTLEEFFLSEQYKEISNSNVV